MIKLVVNHSTAQWHELVREAEDRNGVRLDEELESYLVFLLMRHTQCTELAARAMAIEYLESAQIAGNEHKARMRDIGDQCLLLSGLFPRRAERRRVRVSYYVDLGRSAYQNVADTTQAAMSSMFMHLSESFVALMDTLQAIRSLNTESEMPGPLSAYDLWNDTSSAGASMVLSRLSDSVPVKTKRNQKFRH